MRPPGDADPRVEGLTVITADSFRELAARPYVKSGCCKVCGSVGFDLVFSLSFRLKVLETQSPKYWKLTP